MAIKSEKLYLYGRHALREVLEANPKALKKVFLSTAAAETPEIKSLIKEYGITPNMMKGDEKKVADDAVHQGVIAELAPEALYASFDETFSALKQETNPVVVLLDELHDPHNVGAIIRSAAAFGAKAILIPEHNQAPITGTVIKTSAGMVFRIPIIKIGNVNQTLRKLKDDGFWSYGLVMDGDTQLQQASFDTPSIIIVGNESDGIREKTLELCDIKLSIPMSPGCESLNAATATSVVLYEYWRGIQ